MSRSNPPPSSIAAKVRANSPLDGRPAVPRTRRRKLAVRFAALARWLHIYVSMVGLVAVLFFSVTGITLNHPDWFMGEMERRTEAEGRIDPKFLGAASVVPEPPPESSAGANAEAPEDGVSKLEIVEYLRKAHDVRGALVEFKIDDMECLVAFKGPGYSADAFIDRGDGRYTLTQNIHGFIGVINDLHKGRDSGPVWSLVIDVSALILVLISLSGLILIFYLKLRRVPGVAVAIVGGAVVLLLYWFGVP